MLIALWIITILLTVAYLGAGVMKLTKPRSALIDSGMPWAADFTSPSIKTIALLEVIGALGLILPLTTGIAPILTPIAAVALAALMLGAVVVHARRKESVVAPAILTLLSIVVAVLGFVAFV
ncbi:DoxX-like family protein [Microbacterium sp. ru370.1]|uniref:DoxX family protein n=1 Tax=unclassified Microbacterium TaxID=2609290 RepID=UPI00088BE7C9|nr:MULTISPECIES: DoxX family protein [unclassified Microbacterium]SDO29908.1 DoxX-like family protein [Microbacterium sp. ru370.1]SIT75787.1 DoxX-like family protein [Microbacterium sp. RU1D]